MLSWPTLRRCTGICLEGLISTKTSVRIAGFVAVLNPGPFEYDAGGLTTLLWCLVMLSGVMELFFFILVNTVSATVIF
jgi:hypothetical protein